MLHVFGSDPSATELRAITHSCEAVMRPSWVFTFTVSGTAAEQRDTENDRIKSLLCRLPWQNGNTNSTSYTEVLTYIFSPEATCSGFISPFRQTLG